MNRVVRPKARQIIQQTWQSQANLSLFLVLLIVAVFILPVLDRHRGNYQLDADIVSTLLLVTGVAIGWGRRWLFTLGVLVAIPALILRWSLILRPSPRVQLCAEVCGVIAIVTVGYILLAQVFRDGPINAVRVQGAVAAYLLMGVAYAHAYQIASYFNPTAITSTEGGMTSFIDWIYFSFATLSTLGYGDIIPTGHASRMLAIAEAISGQLFLAILIARLVSMQVAAGVWNRVRPATTGTVNTSGTESKKRRAGEVLANFWRVAAKFASSGKCNIPVALWCNNPT